MVDDVGREVEGHDLGGGKGRLVEGKGGSASAADLGRGKWGGGGTANKTVDNWFIKSGFTLNIHLRVQSCCIQFEENQNKKVCSHVDIRGGGARDPPGSQDTGAPAW